MEKEHLREVWFRVPHQADDRACECACIFAAIWAVFWARHLNAGRSPPSSIPEPLHLTHATPLFTLRPSPNAQPKKPFIKPSRQPLRSPFRQPEATLPTKSYLTRQERPRTPNTRPQKYPAKDEFMSIENLKTIDPFADADEDTGETNQSQSYIHIRIQQRNGRKTLTTVQGLPKKFDQKKILKVIKKQFACNGTIVTDEEMGEVIQLQGDQRKDVRDFLCDKGDGLGLDSKTIKVHGF